MQAINYACCMGNLTSWHVLARFVIDDGCPASRPIAFLLMSA